ncbi:hypothetical protein [Engelhardtia mirabilis]|uniref:Uncharacterized protein n=1 Tax=Engelhardtia mirabilis TaxID=2528011 RepID=A0A518BP00_9BACT|nr:hypothetical protein Pla133_37780 [Planctomycetes bacterium Pla133]QDV03003.1 hypothetical protein Pla86_37770 [Planctomycetes bacterium Pla86]
MRAHDTLHVLCRKHGVPASYGRRLLPLLERAHAAPPEVRDRLVRLVELNLVREANRRRELASPVDDGAEQALVAVARALHRWIPPTWLDGLVDRPSS